MSSFECKIWLNATERVHSNKLQITIFLILNVHFFNNRNGEFLIFYFCIYSGYFANKKLIGKI